MLSVNITLYDTPQVKSDSTFQKWTELTAETVRAADSSLSSAFGAWVGNPREHSRVRVQSPSAAAWNISAEGSLPQHSNTRACVVHVVWCWSSMQRWCLWMLTMWCRMHCFLNVSINQQYLKNKITNTLKNYIFLSVFVFNTHTPLIITLFLCVIS